MHLLLLKCHCGCGEEYSSGASLISCEAVESSPGYGPAELHFRLLRQSTTPEQLTEERVCLGLQVERDGRPWRWGISRHASRNRMLRAHILYCKHEAEGAGSGVSP